MEKILLSVAKHLKPQSPWVILSVAKHLKPQNPWVILKGEVRHLLKSDELRGDIYSGAFNPLSSSPYGCSLLIEILKKIMRENRCLRISETGGVYTAQSQTKVAQGRTENEAVVKLYYEVFCNEN